MNKTALILAVILFLIAGIFIGYNIGYDKGYEDKQCTIIQKTDCPVEIPDCICNCEKTKCPVQKDCISELKSLKQKAEVAEMVWEGTKDDYAEVIR